MSTRRYNLITPQFVGRYNNTNPWLLNTIDESNELSTNTDLFPDKFKNLQQRPIRLALFNYNPYSIWQEVVCLNIFKDSIVFHRYNNVYFDKNKF